MTKAPRILLVDDERPIQRALVPLLRARGYEVDLADDGRSALERFEVSPPDLIVLDLGLPDVPGLEVCRRIRARSVAPIVVLSARGGEADKVEALDLGADDYVTKPFGPDELLARIRVALRRGTGATDWPPGAVQILQDLRIDHDRHHVVRGGCDIRLTPREFELLALRARAPGRVLTHRTILRAIWGPHAMDRPEHLWALVAQLRRKIEPDPAQPRYVLSEPWVGYRLNTE
jgi:two-component system, OmpR family, KDP operon response regulator KdpE